MTKRKIKAVERRCWIAALPLTFKSVLEAAEQQLGPVLDTMSAAQIAALLEYGYAQHNEGRYAAFLDYR